MMKSVLLLLSLLVAISYGFAPAIVKTTSTTTALNMGLFDGPKKKPAPAAGKGKKAGGEKDLNVFGGRGKKITVREDEDAAMWIDEEDAKKKKNIFGF